MSARRKLVLGLLALAVTAGCLVFLAYFPPYSMVPGRGDITPRVMCLTCLKEIGLAMHNYHAAHGHLPPAASRDKDGQPLLSWRVLLLPFLEGMDGLYREFKLDQPWDSQHNKPLLTKMPYCYRDYLLYGPQDQTFFQVFVGPGTAFEGDGVSFKDFPDGTVDTLLVVEAADHVPWTKPQDLAYDPDKPVPALGGRFILPVRWLGWLSKEQPVAEVSFADGSVRPLPTPVEEKFLRSLITRNSGEKVDRTRLE